jgi:hypothetical protein
MIPPGLLEPKQLEIEIDQSEETTEEAVRQLDVQIGDDVSSDESSSTEEDNGGSSSEENVVVGRNVAPISFDIPTNFTGKENSLHAWLAKLFRDNKDIILF